MTLDPARRAKLRDICHAASRPPWTKGRMPEGKDPIAYFAEAHAHGPSDVMHIVCVPDGDAPLDERALFVAITGNGPTSEANARFVACARDALPAALDALDAADRREAELVALLRAIKIEAPRGSYKRYATDIEAFDSKEEYEQAWRDYSALCQRRTTILNLAAPDMPDPPDAVDIDAALAGRGGAG